MNKKIAAILLLLYSVFGGGILNYINIDIKPEPVAEILSIEKPSKKILDTVSPIASLVTDPDDRSKIAIFNYEFAERVIGYETSSQQINDVYALAGKTFFKQTLVDKYEGLSEGIVSIMEKVLTDENHIVTNDEKNELHKHFMGLAWSLING